MVFIAGIKVCDPCLTLIMVVHTMQGAIQVLCFTFFIAAAVGLAYPLSRRRCVASLRIQRCSLHTAAESRPADTWKRPRL